MSGDDEGGGRANLDFTQVGLMQKLTTGNMVFDVVVCLFIPFLFKEVFPRMQDWVSAQVRHLKTWGEFTRYIEHTDEGGYWWCRSDNEPANNVLQKAILLYIAQQDTYTRRFNVANYSLDKSRSEAGGGDDNSDADSDSDSDCGDDNTKELATFSVNTVPNEGMWQQVADRIWFMRTTEVIKNKDFGKDKTKTTFSIRARGRNAKQTADAFVDAAFEYYKEKMAAQVDHTRYLYQPLKAKKSSGSDDDNADNAMLYKRYALSDDKSFDCVFHPIKHRLLSLLDDFNAKKGKYAIRGYPHKLGLLLHGPPGTGKTSMIKALATATGRSVISIPLDKVKTNQQLCDIVFDQRYAVAGDDLPKKLRFNKTIFVFEDIDAAGGVVKRRAGNQADAGTAAAVTELKAKLAAKEREGKDKATSSSGSKRPPAGERDSSASDGGESPAGEASTSSAADPETEKTSKLLSLLEDPDKLNLAGLLNVLDGVVDTPGRIVVMTTNHPENLDPALIRPGRIDFQVYMGRIARKEAGEMIAHYYGDGYDAAAAARLAAAFVDDRMTPAELEAMCANYGTTDELLGALARHLGTQRADNASKAASVPASASGSGRQGSLSSHALLDLGADVEEGAEPGYAPGSPFTSAKGAAAAKDAFMADNMPGHGIVGVMPAGPVGSGLSAA